jgi:hypothetical protein
MTLSFHATEGEVGEGEGEEEEGEEGEGVGAGGEEVEEEVGEREGCVYVYVSEFFSVLCWSYRRVYSCWADVKGLRLLYITLLIVVQCIECHLPS